MTHSSQSTQPQPAPAAGVAPADEQAVVVRFGFKQNEAYDLALRFQVIVQRALAVGCTATLGQQLECGSLSLLLNVAEGYGSSREVRAGRAARGLRRGAALHGAVGRAVSAWRDRGCGQRGWRSVVVAAAGPAGCGPAVVAAQSTAVGASRPPFVRERPARPWHVHVHDASGLHLGVA